MQTSRSVFKILKRITLSLVFALLIFAAGIAIFMNTSPQFGQLPSGEALERIQASPHYEGEQFVNLVETKMDMDGGKLWEVAQEYMSAEQTSPDGPLPVRFGAGTNTRSVADTAIYLTWFGHSAVLLEMEGKRILLDPMLGEASSPVSFLSQRFPYQEEIDVSKLTNIDALIISHDHYDHLDYPTIIQLKDEVKHFYTALGVGSHLRSWGIAAEKITELDWWETADLDHLSFTATPNRHFSGRGITDRNKTQWASWVLVGEKYKIFFSGDGGYANHFKQIGDTYGPFDFTMIECGQYNEKWSEIHMMPEQSVQAHIDLQGKVMMPIHWGAFNLAIHSWTDPIVRAKAEAERRGVELIHPFIGERFDLDQRAPSIDWWKE